MSETLFSKLSGEVIAKDAIPVSSAPLESDRRQVSESCVTTSTRILNLSAEIDNKNDLIKALAQLSRDVLEDSFLWYVETDGESGPRALALTSTDQASLWQLVDDDVMKLLSQPHQPGKVIRSTLQNSSSTLLATILSSGEQPEAVIAVVPARESSLRDTEAFLAEFALSLTACNTRQLNRTSLNQATFYQKLVQLSNIITNVESEEEAHICSVNFVREILEARQVSLVMAACDGSSANVCAISDVDSFDRTSEICLTIRSLAQKTIASGKPSTWRSGIEKRELESESESEVEIEMLTQWKRRFCNLTSSDVATSIPFSINEQTSAALIIAHRNEQTAEATRGFNQAFVTILSNQLQLVRKSSRGVLSVTRDYLLQTLRRKTSKVILGCAGILLAVMLTPFPYTVKSDCHLEPVQRRMVAAPFDAVVDRSFVQNGDLVKAGQLLAQLDGRQLRIELSALQATLQSEQKKHDAALASRDVASSQIANLEVKRLRSEIQLIQRKLKNLEIRSPIDGIIVSGDLEKVEGAPIEIGQNLYEIGPLDQMLVEVEIDEAEIRFVEPGQPVKVLFDAFPFDKFNGKIIRIHPRAEIRDEKSVFIADVEIPNENEMLRPGMKGRCRTRSNWHPLGWNLFHRSYESVRGWLVW